ncbi:MAG: hypothetical protein J7518_21505 [Nocardioidaceae bacterium]|nr:hypothetical protein [Nocardioidaceae bacterium]
MNSRQRRRILQAVCSLLPPDCARKVLAGHPDDYGTYVEAYLAARRLSCLPPGLKRALLAAIFDMMDTETEEALRRRRAVPGA